MVALNLFVKKLQYCPNHSQFSQKSYHQGNEEVAWKDMVVINQKQHIGPDGQS